LRLIKQVFPNKKGIKVKIGGKYMGKDYSSNDMRSMAMNPNSSHYAATMDNHSNQLNPNNSAYWSSRESNGINYNGELFSPDDFTEKIIKPKMEDIISKIEKNATIDISDIELLIYSGRCNEAQLILLNNQLEIAERKRRAEVKEFCNSRMGSSWLFEGDEEYLENNLGRLDIADINIIIFLLDYHRATLSKVLETAAKSKNWPVFEYFVDLFSDTITLHHVIECDCSDSSRFITQECLEWLIINNSEYFIKLYPYSKNRYADKVSRFISLAIDQNCLNILKFLVYGNYIIDFYDYSECFYNAVKLGNIDIVEFMVNKNANISISTLINPYLTENLTLFNFLLNKCSKETLQKCGHELIKYIIPKGDFDLFKLLISCGTDISKSIKSFENLNKNGNEIINYLLGNFDNNFFEVNGHHLLPFAIERGDLELLKKLVLKGTKVSLSTDCFDKISVNGKEIANFLFENGAVIYKEINNQKVIDRTLTNLMKVLML
jgi:hypothetical protein